MSTVLASRPQSERTRVVLWRQCVDLLAQFDRPAASGDGDLDSVVATLESLTPHITLQHRLNSVVELGSRLQSPRLIALLASHEAPVVAATMRRARLPDSVWPELIAGAGPLARSILRGRSDLGPFAQRALDAFGPIDLSLSDQRETALAEREAEPEADIIGYGAAVAAMPDSDQTPTAEPILAPSASVFHIPAPAPDQDNQAENSQIKQLVSRIAQFKNERHVAAPAFMQQLPVEKPVERFSFSTDASGMIGDAAGAPRAALVGLSMGQAGLRGLDGPDGQLLGAFRRRSAVRGAHFSIIDGPLDGTWIVDADPRFDTQTGRFMGYRGDARRRSVLEEAPRLVPVDVPAAPSSQPDDHAPRAAERSPADVAMRQLIHELRTPLHGIMGFAEIIEGQMFGPVTDPYRDMAGNIVSDVHSLVDILEDLDLASRDARHIVAPGPGVDRPALADLLHDAIMRYSDSASSSHIHAADPQGMIAPVCLGRDIAQRLVMHLVRAVAACLDDEQIWARCSQQGNMLILSIDRPRAMRILSDEELFDSGERSDIGDTLAPVLGIGFTLRLVRKLARANDGALLITPDELILRLPACMENAEGNAHSS